MYKVINRSLFLLRIYASNCFVNLGLTDKHEFDKPGWHGKISLLLREHNTSSRTSSPSRTRNDIYERIIRNKEITNALGPYGLTHQHNKPELTSGKDCMLGISMMVVFIGLDAIKTIVGRPHHA